MINLITDHMDVWTAAQVQKGNGGRGRKKKSNGQSLHGIKKLRELILDLAVRGKLVPQDSNDEPAILLLEKIAKERARQIEEGKIKKQKKLPKITNDEIPFELARGWEWVKLGNITSQITDGTHKTPSYLDNGVPFISVKDIDGKTVSFRDCKYISQEQHEEINSRCNPQHGDILICRIGTLGRATIVDTNNPFSIFVSVGLLKCFQHQIIPKFTHLVLHSPLLTKQYDAIKAGGSHTNKLNLRDLPHLLIPVAPLSEQYHIVAKVDELMALCDRLEQQQTDSNETHQTLVETLLTTLTNATDQKEFAKAWQRIANHFDTLFTTEQSIDQLKQTILQLAVMGKLVPQDPNDEPASVALDKIENETALLTKEGKTKKIKKWPGIDEDENPYELPEGWEWVSLGNLVSVMDAGWSPACIAAPSPDASVWGVLKTTAVQIMKYLEDENKELPAKLKPRPQYEVKKGDILITRAGPKNRVGISCLVDESRPKLMISDKIIRFHLFEIGISERFISLCLNAGATADYLEKAKSGMAESQMNISQVKLKAAPIPLCPITEQYRIVTKVDELMALCDDLKAYYIENQTTKVDLADALVEL